MTTDKTEDYSINDSLSMLLLSPLNSTGSFKQFLMEFQENKVEINK